MHNCAPASDAGPEAPCSYPLADKTSGLTLPSLACRHERSPDHDLLPAAQHAQGNSTRQQRHPQLAANAAGPLLLYGPHSGKGPAAICCDVCSRSGWCCHWRHAVAAHVPEDLPGVPGCADGAVLRPHVCIRPRVCVEAGVLTSYLPDAVEFCLILRVRPPDRSRACS